MTDGLENTEQQLRLLLDREAIRDLPVRYCDCVWRADVTGLVSLFCAEGRFAIDIDGERIEYVGPALTPFFEAGLNDGPRPYIHNHVIDLLDEETATGRCYLDLRSAKNGFEWLGAGFYDDSYVKQNGQWKFRERIFHALRIEEWPGNIAQT